ncbi:MAG: hypothetical protein L0G51_00135 [Lactococcus lactis]|nr:hypothetical protein [Lactococcus lactis]
MKEVCDNIIHSFEFNYKTMYSQFNFTYGELDYAGLDGIYKGHVELMLEGNHDWHVELSGKHEPEDVQVVLNELTSKQVAKGFPGWKYCDLTYKHVPNVGWVIHSKLNQIKLENELEFGDK